VEVKSVAPSGDTTTKWIFPYEKNKISIKIDGWNHHMKDKREGQRMAKQPIGPMRIKLGRELVPPMAGSYLTLSLSNVPCKS